MWKGCIPCLWCDVTYDIWYICSKINWGTRLEMRCIVYSASVFTVIKWNADLKNLFLSFLIHSWLRTLCSIIASYADRHGTLAKCRQKFGSALLVNSLNEFCHFNIYILQPLANWCMTFAFLTLNLIYDCRMKLLGNSTVL